jgi:hypothetical protein
LGKFRELGKLSVRQKRAREEMAESTTHMTTSQGLLRTPALLDGVVIPQDRQDRFEIELIGLGKKGRIIEITDYRKLVVVLTM